MMVNWEDTEQVRDLVFNGFTREHAAVVALVARDLAEIFEKDNPDFDFNRFMEAAGVAEMGAL